MERLLKPERFEEDPSSTSAKETWIHWKTTFANFIAKVTDLDDAGKLHLLINHIAPSIFRYINTCTTYDDAVKVLDDLYVKPVNEVFARHKVFSRGQQPGESLDQFLVALKELGKECAFKAVDATTNQNDYIRDAYIRGMTSTHIRLRLLENPTLTLEEAHAQARGLELAQQQSHSYSLPSTVPTPSSCAVTEESRNQTSLKPVLSTSQNPKKCYFCGSAVHPRAVCPARDARCQACDKVGHFSKVCLSSHGRSRHTKGTSACLGTINVVAGAAAYTNCLSKAVIPVVINGLTFDALIDTGSSLSFLSSSTVRKCQIQVRKSTERVSMASAALTTIVNGFCNVDVELLGHKSRGFKMFVMNNLCADVLIGHDLLKQHSSLTISFGGTKPALHICSVAVATISPVSLFANLSPDCKPIITKSRRHSPEDEQFIASEIQKLLEDRIIEKSNSPWRAQVFVVSNSSRKRRMVIDYSQTINRFTFLDAYPIPRVEDVVNKVSKHSVYSTIDLRSAYHQIPILEREKAYTAFEACGKLYHFCRIPFGVTNGVPCFQKTIDSIIEAEGLHGTYPYLDDVTVCGRDQAEHDVNLRKFLEAAKKYNLTINKEKSSFSLKTINLLGYTISNQTIKPDADRLKPLLALPTPDDPNSLERVIGIFSHYSKWISHFSDKIRPLTHAKSFPLSPASVDAFQKLKSDLLNSVMTAIDDSVPFRVETDASDFAIAATLTQSGRPVAFFSRTLSSSEQNHSSIEKEAYAVVESIRHWRHFLLGRHFQILTDQRSVSFMFNMQHTKKIKNEKIMRWRLELSCYSFDIVYRPGTENKAADTLSRIKGPSKTDGTCAFTTNTSISRRVDLQTLHESLCHPGVTRMVHWVRSKNLPFSTEEIRKMTDTCPTCMEVKPRFHIEGSGSLIKATKPFERINVDFKGPLPTSPTGHRYLLTIVDEYSRFPFAYPCSDMSATTIIKHLTELFCLFGLPSYIHSDRGANFMSEELRTFLHSRGVATSRTTPYNPQGNGQIERYNGIIWKAITLSLRSNNLKPTQWMLVLNDALHSIRSLLCTATNSTPHDRMFVHSRRSTHGSSLPRWLLNPGKVFLKKQVRHSKYDPLVEEVDLIEANPDYAWVKLPDGRETTVSLRHLAPKSDFLLHENDQQEDVNDSLQPITERSHEPQLQLHPEPSATLPLEAAGGSKEEVPSIQDQDQSTPRRSTRIRKLPEYLKDFVLK